MRSSGCCWSPSQPRRSAGSKQGSNLAAELLGLPLAVGMLVRLPQPRPQQGSALIHHGAVGIAAGPGGCGGWAGGGQPQRERGAELAPSFWLSTMGGTGAMGDGKGEMGTGERLMRGRLMECGWTRWPCCHFWRCPGVPGHLRLGAVRVRMGSSPHGELLLATATPRAPCA